MLINSSITLKQSAQQCKRAGYTTFGTSGFATKHLHRSSAVDRNSVACGRNESSTVVLNCRQLAAMRRRSMTKSLIFEY